MEVKKEEIWNGEVRSEAVELPSKEAKKKATRTMAFSRGRGTESRSVLLPFVLCADDGDPVVCVRTGDLWGGKGAGFFGFTGARIEPLDGIE